MVRIVEDRSTFTSPRCAEKLGDPALIETVRGVGLRLVGVSRRLLASYLALTLVVLVALEVPLGDRERTRRAAAT